MTVCVCFSQKSLARSLGLAFHTEVPGWALICFCLPHLEKVFSVLDASLS